MNTKEQQAQQLREAAYIIESGDEWEVKRHGQDKWDLHEDDGNPIFWIAQGYEVHIKPLPEKWAAEKAAFKEGKVIEWRPNSNTHWRTHLPFNQGGGITDSEGFEFRIADPYAELKAAHAAGSVIQYANPNHNDKWTDVDGSLASCWGMPASYYRVKPAPVMVRLEASDVPPGSVLGNRNLGPGEWMAINCVDAEGVYVKWEVRSGLIPWDELKDKGWNILRPGCTWEPCCKVKEA